MLIFAPVAAVATSVLAPVVNLIAVALEAVIGLVFSGFSLGRMSRKKEENSSKTSVVVGLSILVGILLVIGWFLLAPKILNRSITLIAEDGYSLPFAAVIIQTGSGDEHERTDSSGTVTLSRFRTKALTIKDPRYVEKTWAKRDLEDELVVERTVLGSGLDSLAEKLLKKAGK